MESESFTNFAIRMVDDTLRAIGVDTKPAAPLAVLSSQLKASLLLEEKKAQLETARLLEIAHRDTLVALYGSLAYYAEMFRFRLETREWVQVPGEKRLTMSRVTREIVEAEAKHEDMVEQIADMAATIAEIERGAQ